MSIRVAFVSVLAEVAKKPSSGPANESVRQRRLMTPAHIVLLGGTAICIGILWDISWHRTIGRDTFWTPAHMAIYFGGVLGGFACGWLVIRNTFFATAEEKAATVGVWGFRGPFGAWVTIWGALAMLISAPFDNWWHDAYGVDVKILSPPHSVLAVGMWAIVLGALFLLLREQNLAPTEETGPRSGLFVYSGGIIVAMASVFLIEHSFPNSQRTRIFYQLSCATYPCYLVALGRGSGGRWGATLVAMWYMAIVMLMAWVLPLFPGQPHLGPIYNPVTHFVPLPFPLLLVVPGLAIDVVRQQLGHGKGQTRDWLLALAVGAAFLLLFLVRNGSSQRFCSAREHKTGSSPRIGTGATAKQPASGVISSGARPIEAITRRLM